MITIVFIFVVQYYTEDMKQLRSRDLTNVKLGRLLVIERAEDINDRIHWKCLCDCGNTITVMAATLNKSSKPTRSCGCLRKENTFSQIEYGRSAFNQVLKAYRFGASSRGLPFSLTEDEFRDLTKKNCHYCGEEPSKETSFVANGQYRYNGLDRVDNSKGYTLENCVPCCQQCNFLKGKMNVESFLNQCLKVAKHMTSNGYYSESVSFYDASKSRWE